MGIYPDDKSTPVAQACAATQYQRIANKTVPLGIDLPGTVILIHGVNDVGVSYGEVESGVCAGLSKRLDRSFFPGTVNMPKPEDAKHLVDDPDAVYFKRAVNKETLSPVIPFYWGYREGEDFVNPPEKTSHGQALDRYGNRLDKDFSKGGGPFSNATSSLPDMWRFGFAAGPGDATDLAAADPIRPVLKAPGRMYMVLAAQRMAALISMIRDWHADETVSIVAHSQGCMVSLLAQAFLLDKGLKPVDTLIMTHPPYSLVDDIPWLNDGVNLFEGGQDELMAAKEDRDKGIRTPDKYGSLRGIQTLHARLQTLVNIVGGVVAQRHSTPEFETLGLPKQCGVVGTRWQASKDRDNRGKVYLYFCPEDRTVALSNIQGIGWQGVPDYQVNKRGEVSGNLKQGDTRRPLKELGAGFFQRVFTAKKRPGPVLVGQAQPHDFILRLKGEDDSEHAAKGSGTLRKDSIAVDPTRSLEDSPYGRQGVRTINGEPLPEPVEAAMYEGSVTLPGQPKGGHETVDPIDAAIASTSRFGYRLIWLLMPDQHGLGRASGPGPIESPHQQLHQGKVTVETARVGEVGGVLNEGKTQAADRCEVVYVYNCLDRSMRGTGQFLVCRKETPNEARLRWQKEHSARSFHGAIFGSATNHRQVTAYDIAVGQGKAPSDPKFYAYLCAVADWRLKKIFGEEQLRSGILEWEKFLAKFGQFYGVEPDWRKDVIEGNSTYYSTGQLPPWLPVPMEGLPKAVVSSIKDGPPPLPPRPKRQPGENPGATTPVPVRRP